MIRRRKALIGMGALIAIMVGCGAVHQVAGYPPEASRRSPPQGIDERAQTTTSPAPALKLQSTLGPTKVAASGRYLLVFYRGHW